MVCCDVGCGSGPGALVRLEGIHGEILVDGRRFSEDGRNVVTDGAVFEQE